MDVLLSAHIDRCYRAVRVFTRMHPFHPTECTFQLCAKNINNGRAALFLPRRAIFSNLARVGQSPPAASAFAPITRAFPLIW